MKKSSEQLKEELRECSDIQPGTRWMHKGGAIVDIIALAHMAMPDGNDFDGETCVVYMHDRTVWVRPVGLFREKFQEMPSTIRVKKKKDS